MRHSERRGSPPPNHKQRRGKSGGSLGRRGAMALEAAIVMPVMFMLLLLLIVGGMGVFRYQQVACQAREAARWASVHGSRWRATTQQSAVTQQDILQNAVLPYAIGMDASLLNLQAELVDGITGSVVSWDRSNRAIYALTPGNQGVTNRVRITLTYTWSPGIVLPGSLTLTSISEMPMSF
jgi:Flp pilus assembly protein TadG